MTIRTALLVVLLARYVLKRWPKPVFITNCHFTASEGGPGLMIRQAR